MTAGRSIEVHALHWQGVDLEVTFERNWLNIERDQATAHLSVTSIAPEASSRPLKPPKLGGFHDAHGFAIVANGFFVRLNVRFHVGFS